MDPLECRCELFSKDLIAIDKTQEVRCDWDGKISREIGLVVCLSCQNPLEVRVEELCNKLLFYQSVFAFSHPLSNYGKGESYIKF